MKILLLSFIVILFSCASHIKQFYPDNYLKEDFIYTNKVLRFSINYQSAWLIETDPNKMERRLKKIARDYQKDGIEFLYVGTTPDALQGTQAVAVNLNTPVKEYASSYKLLNKEFMEKDFGLTEMLIDGIPMIKWEYQKFGFHFAEFFFTFDTYNIRIAFWSKPVIFNKFYNEYLSIMSSIDFVSMY